MTMPRCVRYASLPEFLRRDWTSTFSLHGLPYTWFQLELYQQIYTNAMHATAFTDANYTQKPAM
jgi:hypothetical protein